MNRFSCITFLIVSLSGCGIIDSIRLPQTEGERLSGYTYIPLDPLPVTPKCIWGGDTQFLYGSAYHLPNTRPLLKFLPDNAVRIATAEVNAKGELTYGVGTTNSSAFKYRIILDHVNVDTSNITLKIFKRPKPNERNERNPTYEYKFQRVFTDEEVTAGAKNINYSLADDEIETEVVIPVYVGIGLRMTAEITSVKGEIGLSLPAIASAATAGKASGSLAVQTLGITGKQTSVTLPMPSELNQTTLLNSVLSLGSVKAILFDKDDTVLHARVTGMYLPMSADVNTVNAVVSELAKHTITWKVHCGKEKSEAQVDGLYDKSTKLN